MPLIKTSFLRRTNSFGTDTEIVESNDTKSSWNWVPPRHTSPKIDEDDLIPIIPKTLLTTKEIISALSRQGGEDITIINLSGKLDTIDDFILVSGKSSRHLSMMGHTLVRALKSRSLLHAPGVTGIEGDAEDDWKLVDCYNIVVHLLLPEKRKMLNLEAHWRNDERPAVSMTLNEKVNDKNFEDMLARYPLPDNFRPSVIEKDYSQRDKLARPDPSRAKIF